MEEIFKEINGYEGYYEVSNNGKIRRTKYYDNGNKKRHNIPYYLKPAIDKDGYFRVSLSKNYKYKRFFIHRLVAQTFIPNPNNYPCVNHIDGNKSNNNVNNLEWCTIAYNNIHALNNGLKNMKIHNWKTSKIVEKYDLNGNFIESYKSSGEAGRVNKISSENIRNCCRGEVKTYKGYIWKYKSNESSTTIENT